MSSEGIIEFKDVWKKYSMRDIFHNSLREEITGIFKKGGKDKLSSVEFWALKGINISIKRGECVGLFGPNGAGKTTILKLIASVTYPSLGKIGVAGRVAPLISVGAGFHPDLTGRENIYTNGTIIGMSIGEIRAKIDSIIAFSDIEERFLDMPIKKYSNGMNARLGFSIAIHSSADIILIDEILAVGDESFQEKCINKIKELIHNKKTIVIVSHDRKLMLELTSRIIYIKDGSISSNQ
ncbi:MAG: ABC transporter ATP-binding protein [Thermodesulfobacteriota bacterium]